MLNSFIKKSQPAFSIIEMLVSISIIALISGIFLVNYRNGIRRSDLSMATNIMAADTRMAQSYSLGLVKYDAVFPDGGWGVNFDLATPDRYYFFADGGVFDTASDQVRQNEESLPQYKAKTVVFSTGIKITDIKIKDDNDLWFSISNLVVTFLPPRPTTNVHNVAGDWNGREALITLTNNQNSTTMQMTVNSFGLIDIVP
ncbi:MAG: type II secretion system protein [Candidatus Falkowbacteria bacterium]|nr:type II secretion system protein [Candidatus Falkowbacteria bacterium]